MIYNFDGLTFQILTVDRYFYREGFFDVKPRPFDALSFRISGRCEFEVVNKNFVVEAGDVLFMPANTPYRVQSTAGESVFVHFVECNYREAEKISVQNPAEVEICFIKMLDAWNKERSVNQAKANVYDIFCKISKESSPSGECTPFAVCLKYMEENFCDPTLDIETVCSYGYISPSSLWRAFKTHFGMSPVQYLIKLRMNKALDMLTDGELSVKEIALRCGFEDEKYFSRAFKERYGYPPSHIHKKMFV